MSRKYKKHRHLRRLLLILAILAVLIVPGLFNGLTVRTYTVRSEKLSAPVRLVMISDLHSCAYGKEEEELLSAVAELRPDAVLLCGDIFDNKLPDDNAVALLTALGRDYPCYSVTGNHEYNRGRKAIARNEALVDSLGVIRLPNEAVTVTLNGTEIDFCGIHDPDSTNFFPDNPTTEQALEKVTAEKKEGPFTLLLAHRPEGFPEYSRYDFDLVLCGHAHGGQWRIPGLVNGLFTPDQGLFPKYAGGLYEENGVTMIVGRGLAREAVPVPRLYNPPELVVIELIPETPVDGQDARR